jgi:hypothetical protein
VPGLGAGGQQCHGGPRFAVEAQLCDLARDPIRARSRGERIGLVIAAAGHLARARTGRGLMAALRCRAPRRAMNRAVALAHVTAARTVRTACRGRQCPERGDREPRQQHRCADPPPRGHRLSDSSDRETGFQQPFLVGVGLTSFCTKPFEILSAPRAHPPRGPLEGAPSGPPCARRPSAHRSSRSTSAKPSARCSWSRCSRSVIG